ncbi:hypothetical protein C1H46_037677 [Malus baccata]|uniref:Uncharacterized protein n=1 Tax=Malus baccata TaxID=106549 RepID=A0A540KRB5_MALBA|nr:hypothetical protein C1H46_037677 [Malus baccata]
MFRHALEDSRPQYVLINLLSACIYLFDPMRLTSRTYENFNGFEIANGSVVAANPATVVGMLEILVKKAKKKTLTVNTYKARKKKAEVMRSRKAKQCLDAVQRGAAASACTCRLSLIWGFEFGGGGEIGKDKVFRDFVLIGWVFCSKGTDPIKFECADLRALDAKISNCL